MPLLHNTNGAVTTLNEDGETYAKDENGNFHVPHEVYNRLVNTGTWVAGTLPAQTARVAAFVPDLTDSTGGVAADELVVVRSDTAAHTAADANANFASLAEQIKDITDAMKAAGSMASS